MDKTSLLERLRIGPVWGNGEPIGSVVGAINGATMNEAADRITHLEAEIERLRDHIAEQITHVETRIKDGAQLGATVWRIALEDVVRENRAAVAHPNPKETPQ